MIKELIKKLRPSGIRAELMLGIALINVVLISLFVMEQMDRQRGFFLSLNNDRAIGNVTNLANNSASYVIANELAALQKLVASYKNIPGLKYAEVTSEDGIVLAHTEEKYLGMKATDSISAKLKPVNATQTLVENNLVLDVAAPILNQGEIIGWARIAMSQDEMASNLADIKKRGIIYILISLLVGILFAVLVAGRLTKGLQTLVAASKKISAGERDIRVSSASSTEISELGTAFNQMLDNISSKEKLLSNVLENMPVGVFILDEKGKVLTANPAGEDLWKGIRYVGTDEYNLYKAWFTETGKAIQNHEWGAAIVLSEGRSVLNQEIEIECFDKSHKIILNSAIPLKDANNKITGVITINVDITERKAAEEKIRESEERYKSIIAVSNTGAWEYHGDSGYLWCSTEYFSMLGRSRSDFDFSGEKNLKETWIDLLHPEDVERASSHFAEYLKNGSVGTYESYFRMQNSNGGWVWIWSRGQTLRDASGNLTNLTVGTHIDITEQKRSEDLIRASERTRKHIINSALDAIVGMDKKGLIIIWTPQAERIFGWKEEEVLGKRMSEVIIPHEQRIHHERGLSHHVKTGEGPLLNKTLEVTALHRSGKEFPVELSIAVVNDTDNDFYCAFIRDISERKESEKKLRHNEERNRALIENISDTIILLSEKIELVYVSPSFVRTAGFSLEEHNGKDTLDFVHPDDVGECRTILKQSMSMPGESIPSQLRLLHKNGKYIWIEGSITNLLHNESVKALVINYRNITERKEFEEQQRSMEHEREKTIDELLQRNRDLEQFSHIVSHNLRGPLATMIGLTSLMKKGDLSPKEMDQVTLGIGSHANSMDNVIKDLNNILKIKREINEKKESVRFSELLNDVQNSISTTIEAEKVKIISNFSENDQTITLKSYMHSIFYNLVSNGIKYRRAGVQPTIEIASSLKEGRIVLTFKDNGIGIDLKRHKEEIFGLYKKFNFDIEGKGMGLFMVKTQVTALQGTIEVLSELGKGTEFIISLPA